MNILPLVPSWPVLAGYARARGGAPGLDASGGQSYADVLDISRTGPCSGLRLAPAWRPTRKTASSQTCARSELGSAQPSPRRRKGSPPRTAAPSTDTRQMRTLSHRDSRAGRQDLCGEPVGVLARLRSGAVVDRGRQARGPTVGLASPVNWSRSLSPGTASTPRRRSQSTVTAIVLGWAQAEASFAGRETHSHLTSRSSSRNPGGEKTRPEGGRCGCLPPSSTRHDCMSMRKRVGSGLA